jgi:hypothetical protein
MSSSSVFCFLLADSNPLVDLGKVLLLASEELLVLMTRVCCGKQCSIRHLFFFLYLLSFVFSIGRTKYLILSGTCEALETI